MHRIAAINARPHPDEHQFARILPWVPALGSAGHGGPPRSGVAPVGAMPHSTAVIRLPSGQWTNPRITGSPRSKTYGSPRRRRRRNAGSASRRDRARDTPSTGSQFLRVFPPIMLPMFLAVADQTIVATALPAIASSLGEIERASWVVVSYLIANTIAAPVYGRLGDTFGRRWMMFMALGIFILGSVLCALAPNITLLTLFRVVQGFGGGGLMTLSQAMIGESIAAARTRPLSGISCGHRGQFQHLRPGRRRLPHPGLRLAVDLPHQYSARASRGLVRVPDPGAPGRPPPHHLRFAGPGVCSSSSSGR